MKSNFFRACQWLVLLPLPMFVINCATSNEVKTQTFHPIEDAMVHSQQSQSDNTFGTMTLLYIGSDGNGAKRSYFLFDVSSIPSNAQVVAGNLRLYYSYQVDPATVTISAHEVTSLWNQTNLTWNNQPTYDPTIVAVKEIPLAANKQGNWHTWLLLDLVQGWINHTITNYGVLLKSTSEHTTSSFKVFRSSDDYEHSNEWPVLNIVYTIP